jgi:hypothetical protein
MKKHLLAAFLLLSCFAFAQNPIPNYDFETGSGSTLTGWYAPSVGGCTKSTQAHGGSSALKMAPWGASLYGAIAFTPASGQGFHLNGLNPTSLSGWYMANFANGDQMSITVTVYSGGSATGSGYAILNTNASTYTQFTVAIYNGGSTADSAKIQFNQSTSMYGSSGLSASTYVIVDDLQLIGAVGIKNNSAPNFNAWFNSVSSTLDVKAEASSIVNLSLIELTGKRVLAAENLQAGNSPLKIPAAGLSPGVYLLRMQCDEAIVTKKIVIE